MDSPPPKTENCAPEPTSHASSYPETDFSTYSRLGLSRLVGATSDVAAAQRTRPLRDSAARRYAAVIKRSVDIAVAALTLLIASPLLFLVGLIVKLSSPRGPIFFGHERIGRNGKPFRCWKFRSMVPDATGILVSDPELYLTYEQNDFKLPMKNDPRITPLGRILRAAQLDELPQLWNVLLGEMSLVGPRPIVEAELRWYGENSRDLLSVRPGITGAWQITGKERVRYPERASYELEYVHHWSLRLDFVILLATLISAIVPRKGVRVFSYHERRK
ncbi:MAG: sugar transferase [Acidimicrobiales bacterium]